MNKEAFRFIKKEVTRQENTFVLIRRGVNKATRMLVHTVRMKDYAFLGSLDIILKIFCYRLNVTEKDLFLLFKFHEAAIFNVNDISVITGLKIARSYNIATKFHEKGLIEIKKKKGKERIFVLSKKSSDEIYSMYVMLLRGFKISLREEFLPKEIIENQHLYRGVIEHNKKVKAFKKNVIEIEERIINNDQGKEEALCYKEM